MSVYVICKNGIATGRNTTTPAGLAVGATGVSGSIGTVRLSGGGANAAGLALGIAIQTGVASCSWPHTSLRG